MSDEPTRRRRVLRGIAATVGGGPLLAGCSGGGATPEPTAEQTATSAGSTEPLDDTFGGWLNGVEDAGTLHDLTGQSEVRIRVGAQGNGGYFAFAPVVVRLSPGTAVTWEWTGRGGAHNVVAEDRSFESGLSSTEGTTFSQTFDENGVTKYGCTPHLSMGMKGVVVVE